jgi:hypothetical protein
MSVPEIYHVFFFIFCFYKLPFCTQAHTFLVIRGVLLILMLMIISYYVSTCPKLLAGFQGRPLGGASGALAPGADFEGAPKRQSPTGHTLIRITIAW